MSELFIKGTSAHHLPFRGMKRWITVNSSNN